MRTLIAERLQIPKVCICIPGQRASNIISKRVAFAAFSGESNKLRSRGVVQGRMLMRPGKNVHIDSYPRAIFAIVNGIASATNWLKGAQSNEYMIVGKKIMDRQIPKGFLRSLLERLVVRLSTSCALMWPHACIARDSICSAQHHISPVHGGGDEW